MSSSKHAEPESEYGAGAGAAALLVPDIIYSIARLLHPAPIINLDVNISIFPGHSVAAAAANNNDNDDNDEIGDGIIKLTHVCRSWRNALLSYPSFWTKIHIRLGHGGSGSDSVVQRQRVEWGLWMLERILRRSADYPVDVVFDMVGSSELAPAPAPAPVKEEEEREERAVSIPVPWSCRFSDVLFSHLSHIQSLVIRGSASINALHLFQSDLDYIFAFLDKLVPMLKDLKLEMLASANANAEDEDEDRVVRLRVPENLLVPKSIAPPNKEKKNNLEALHVVHMSISHQMPILRIITRLYLHHVSGITSLCQLLDMLQTTSQLLQHLEIDSLLDDISSWSESRETHSRVVRFCALERLALGGLRPGVLMALLSHIAVPSGVHWSIDCGDVVNRSNVDMDGLLSFMNNVGVGFGEGQSLILNVGDTNLQMDFYPARTTHDENSIASLRMMELSLEDDCARRLNLIFRHFNNNHLSQVRFCRMVYGQRERHSYIGWMRKYDIMFRPFLSLLDNLEKLDIECESPTIVNQFVGQLLPPVSATATTSTSMAVLPCPRLSDMTVGVLSTYAGSFLANVLLSRRKETRCEVLKRLCVECDYDDCSVRTVKPKLSRSVEQLEVVVVGDKRLLSSIKRKRF